MEIVNTSSTIHILKMKIETGALRYADRCVSPWHCVALFLRVARNCRLLSEAQILKTQTHKQETNHQKSADPSKRQAGGTTSSPRFLQQQHFQNDGPDPMCSGMSLLSSPQTFNERLQEHDSTAALMEDATIESLRSRCLGFTSCSTSRCNAHRHIKSSDIKVLKWMQIQQLAHAHVAATQQDATHHHTHHCTTMLCVATVCCDTISYDTVGYYNRSNHRMSSYCIT